jgi:predicted alpha/beta-fold hydrolase
MTQSLAMHGSPIAWHGDATAPHYQLSVLPTSHLSGVARFTCTPFQFYHQGFNKIYNWNLASSLKKIFLKHQPLWRTYKGPGQPELVPEVKTIREFDEAITVHSFGE